MSIETFAEIHSLLSAGRISPRKLHQIWEQRRPAPDPSGSKKSLPAGKQIPWLQNDPDLAWQFVQQAMKAEEYLLVCDLARENRRVHGTTENRPAHYLSIELQFARALSRLGATREARSQLESNLGSPMSDATRSEMLSAIGEIIREESHHLPARAARIAALQEALQFYSEARRYDPARLDATIVSAGVSKILGDHAGAVRDAEETLRLVKSREEQSKARHIETDLARAAALAVLGRLDEAAAAYSSLKDSPGQTTALLAEARYHARFLAEAAGQEPDFFKAAFPPLQLLLFAGHMPTGPDGRFPAEKVPEVRDAIRQTLSRIDARAGLGSAAAGGDLIFLDELLHRDASVHIVLPWAREEFLHTSVLCAGDPPAPELHWKLIFDRALDRAASIRELGQLYQPSNDTGWQYMWEVACGLALLTARVSRLDLQPVVLWDGFDGGAGGTASFVKSCYRFFGEAPIVIDLQTKGKPPVFNLATERSETGMMRQEVKSMLFADIVGYSRLTEKVIPEFVGIFMPRVAQLVASSLHAPVSINTWGDAVYAVFDFASDAGTFALELVQMIREMEPEWLRCGLYWEEAGPEGQKVRRPLNIRVGLHTGPVFLHYDPVVRRLGYTGAHVNRAARIEPIAQPGEVYASEEFASLAALDTRIAETDGQPPRGKGSFVCEYAGTMPLAKGYPGRYRIYRVLPKRVLDIESLAKAIHDDYCAKERERGATPATNPALIAWTDLPEDLKQANRAQAADIPNKLRLLGYELAPLHGIRPEDVEIDPVQLDHAAQREHARWEAERRRQGWTYAPQRDNSRKLHDQLIPWDQLTPAQKEKDKDAVRNALRLAGAAGFRLRAIAGGKQRKE